MRENDLFLAIRTQFVAAFAAQGHEVTVAQAFQPTSQGRITAAALYLAQIGVAQPVGSPRRAVEADPDVPLGMIRRETQWYVTTFQATGANISATGLSAADVAVVARDLLQSEIVMLPLRAAGIEVLPPGAVRQLHIVNEEDQYEAIPSFDFALTHETVTLSKIPAAASTEYRQHPV